MFPMYNLNIFIMEINKNVIMTLEGKLAEYVKTRNVESSSIFDQFYSCGDCRSKRGFY